MRVSVYQCISVSMYRCTRIVSHHSPLQVPDMARGDGTRALMTGLRFRKNTTLPIKVGDGRAILSAKVVSVDYSQSFAYFVEWDVFDHNDGSHYPPMPSPHISLTDLDPDLMRPPNAALDVSESWQLVEADHGQHLPGSCPISGVPFPGEVCPDCLTDSSERVCPTCRRGSLAWRTGVRTRRAGGDGPSA